MLIRAGSGTWRAQRQINSKVGRRRDEVQAGGAEGRGSRYPTPRATQHRGKTCQLHSEGHADMVLAFNPTWGSLEAKGGSGVEDFEGATLERRAPAEKRATWWSFSHNERKEERHTNFLNDVSFRDPVRDQKNMQMIPNRSSPPVEVSPGLSKSGQRETACSYLT